MEFADNSKATFGADADLQIYHDASDSYIRDAGTGNLRLEGNDVRVANADSSADYIRCTNGGAVDLLHNNSVVVSTAAGGLANPSGDFTLDVADTLIIDVDGSDIFLKDGGVQFGALRNTSGNLFIQSGSTTAATFSGANVTFAGTLASGAITSSGNITAFSDERLKTNIKTIESGLDKVSKMRGVTFNRDDKLDSGVIAQELEEIAPELVKTADDEMGTKSVAYGNMVGYLIEAVKELKVELDNHKKNCHCKEE